MYRLTLDGAQYYYANLSEAIDRLCLYFKKFNLTSHLLSGRFEKTSMPNGTPKYKKYIIVTDTCPSLSCEVFKQEKQELVIELVTFYIKKWLEKNNEIH